MFFGPEIILLSLCFFWLIALTFLFVKFYNYYSKLTKHTKGESLQQVLDELFEHNKKTNKTIEELKKAERIIAENSLRHIQKIGLIRFNPFKDTGGDQSFILALLDAKNTGVVISSLHTRTGTRWYAKRIVAGKGLEYTLSEDEEKAVAEARLEKVAL